MKNFVVCFGWLSILGVILLWSTSASAQSVAQLYSQQSGTGTFYGTTTAQSGACSFQMGYPAAATNSPVNFTVAMNGVEWFGSLSCGACVQGTGTGGQGAVLIVGNFVAFVDDECPECTSGDLDVGLPVGSGGATPITWKLVDCPVGSSKIQYTYAAGTNPSYIKVQVVNHRVPVASMIIYNSGSAVTMTKSSDNYFLLPSGYPTITPPLQIGIISFVGEHLNDTIPNITPSILINSPNSIQFSPSSNPTPPPAPITSSSIPTPPPAPITSSSIPTPPPAPITSSSIPTPPPAPITSSQLPPPPPPPAPITSGYTPESITSGYTPEDITSGYTPEPMMTTGAYRPPPPPPVATTASPTTASFPFGNCTVTAGCPQNSVCTGHYCTCNRGYVVNGRSCVQAFSPDELDASSSRKTSFSILFVVLLGSYFM